MSPPVPAPGRLPPLRARVVPVASVDEPTLRRLFALFQQYYDCVGWEAFVADFRAKDDVILLVADEVRGFSTLKSVRVEVGGRTRLGVYSGDTVVDRPYWGTKVLGRAFLWYLFRARLRSPLQDLWWVLISKGYKTYLLMANNFPEHYPTVGGPTPAEVTAIRDAFGASLFAPHYQAAEGVIRFPSSRGQLRPGIADVTDGLARQNPRVALFEALNPGWAQGDELMCLARMGWGMPFRYLAKAWRDRLERRRRAALAAPTEAA